MGFAQVDPSCDTRQAVWSEEHPTDVPGGDSQQSARVMALPPEVRSSDIPPGAGAANLTPVVRADDVPQVGRMETIQRATPPDSVQMSPDLPQTVAFDDMADSSMPLSPNCVQVGKSQDVPEKGTVFDVSPVTPGFLMRLSGTAVQQPVACLPLPQALCSEIR